VTLAGYLCC